MGLLTSLFRAASIENPTFNLNDPEAFDALGAEKGRAGIRITPDKALSVSAWFRGISLVSGDVAKIPLITYERDGDGKHRAPQHPSFKLLHRQSNQYLTAFHLKELLTSHALVYGNGYAWINRSMGVTPIELIPLCPKSTQPWLIDGQPFYKVQFGDDERFIHGVDILHIKGFGFDGLQGYSVFDKARESLGVSMASKNFTSTFFANSARASVAITAPEFLSDKVANAIQARWERMHSGVDNSHRVAVLGSGAQIKELSVSPDDAQMIETRIFETREIANFVGVPAHKLGDQTKHGYSSLEQENQAYINDTLDTWFCRWEAECDSKLLTEQEKDADSFFTEFLRQALARADISTRAGFYSGALGVPFMTVNEVRARENLNPIEGGDTVATPLNFTEGAGSETETETDDDAVDDTQEEEEQEASIEPPTIKPDEAQLKQMAMNVLSDAIVRMTKRVCHQAVRASLSGKAYGSFIASIHERNKYAFNAALKEPIRISDVTRGVAVDSESFSTWLLNHLESRFVEASDCQESELKSSVTNCVSKINQDIVSLSFLQISKR